MAASPDLSFRQQASADRAAALRSTPRAGCGECSRGRPIWILDFDVDMEVVRRGRRKQVTDSAFLHVGHCIHIEVLKTFMRDHSVSFAEG